VGNMVPGEMSFRITGQKDNGNPLAGKFLIKRRRGCDTSKERSGVEGDGPSSKIRKVTLSRLADSRKKKFEWA